MSNSITDNSGNAGAGVGAGIGSLIPGIGTVIGGFLGKLFGGLISTGEHPTQADLDIGKALRPMMTAWTAYEISLHPGDSVGLTTWNNNLEGSLGSSNALHAFMTLQAEMMTNKYKTPLLPLEFYKAWNILANMSGDMEAVIAVPAGAIYSNEYVTQTVNNTKQQGTTIIGAGNTKPITDVIKNTTGINLSSTNLFLIVGLVGALAFMFLKGKK